MLKKIIFSFLICLNTTQAIATDQFDTTSPIWPNASELLLLEGPNELTKQEAILAANQDVESVLKAARIAIDKPDMQASAFAWLMTLLKMPVTADNAATQKAAFDELAHCYPEKAYRHIVDRKIMVKWLPDLLSYEVPTGYLITPIPAFEGKLDLNECIRFLERLIENEDKYTGHAYYILHLCYIKKGDTNSPAVHKRIRECLQLSAHTYMKVDPLATLGQYYAFGLHGFKKDPEKAEYYITKASGYNAKYYYNYGQMLEAGLVAKDHITAETAYGFAALEGCEKSKKRLEEISAEKAKTNKTSSWFGLF